MAPTATNPAFSYKGTAHPRGIQRHGAARDVAQRPLHQLPPDAASLPLRRDDHHAERGMPRIVLPGEDRSDDARGIGGHVTGAERARRNLQSSRRCGQPTATDSRWAAATSVRANLRYFTGMRPWSQMRAANYADSRGQNSFLYAVRAANRRWLRARLCCNLSGPSPEPHTMTAVSTQARTASRDMIFRPKYITFDCYGTLTRFRMGDVAREMFADRVPAARMDAVRRRLRGLPPRRGAGRLEALRRRARERDPAHVPPHGRSSTATTRGASTTTRCRPGVRTPTCRSRWRASRRKFRW